MPGRRGRGRLSETMSDHDLAAAGRRWAVATPHHAATDAAADVFRAGGNAVDAAVTAAVTLAVVYPHMCGVGGDLFALVQEPDGQAIAINSSGAAPLGIDADAVRAANARMPERGPLTITVPGAVAGWEAVLAEGGSIPWPAAFDHAIPLAAEGMDVSRSLASTLSAGAPLLDPDPGMREVFYPGGSPAPPGSVLRQPALAASLRAIAERGPGALYGGELGERYAAGLASAGSPMSPADLEGHRIEIAPPLAGRYSGFDVRVVPPNSQGFVLLEILAAIERLGIVTDPLGPDAGTMAHLFRAASADRDRHNADPFVARVPIAALLDDGHIAALADQARGAAEPPRPSDARPAATSVPDLRHLRGDTIALVTADGDGRAVSLIQSLYNGFGSGILEPDTGIVAHNRGACFTLDASSRNALEGGKRPAHTLMPVLVHRADGLAGVLGTMGGSAQPQINAMSVLRLFDLGLTPEDALRSPRWLVDGMDAADPRRSAIAEAGVPSEAMASLDRAGFEIDVVANLSDDVGHAHAIRCAPDGTMEAASDPRADGSAAAG
jgi:oxamate amidohydrolase